MWLVCGAWRACLRLMQPISVPCSGVDRPFGMSVANWPIVPTPVMMDADECGAVAGMCGRGN
jgi:hypothetical protein